MRFYGRDALLLFIRETRHGFSQLTSLSAPRCLREQTRSSKIGTDAAGYKPHDVCVSKLEVLKLARMPVNLQYLYSELL